MKHKNMQRGIKQPLVTKEQPVRLSRHGRIIHGQPPKGMTDQRPSPFVKHWRTVEDDGTGKLVVKHHSRPMTLEEIQTARTIKVAGASTGSYGLKNLIPNRKATK